MGLVLCFALFQACSTCTDGLVTLGTFRHTIFTEITTLVCHSSLMRLLHLHIRGVAVIAIRRSSSKALKSSITREALLPMPLGRLLSCVPIVFHTRYFICKKIQRGDVIHIKKSGGSKLRCLCFPLYQK